jgi:hypothetical protein
MQMKLSFNPKKQIKDKDLPKVQEAMVKIVKEEPISV